MKTPIVPCRAAVLATGGVILAAWLATVCPATAQDQPPGAPPAPAVQPTESSPLSAPAKTTAGAPPVAPAPPAAPAAPSIPGAPFALPSGAIAPAPAPPAAKPARVPGFDQPRKRTVADIVLSEEGLASPHDTARHYEAVLAAFDSQRAEAAQAVFRLGETYRKLGRLDEARIQYARILREFVDFPDLAALSQQQLAHSLPRQQANPGGNQFDTGLVPGVAPAYARSREAAEAAADAERELLMEEIALLEHQLRGISTQIASGVAPDISAIPVQREILQLKRLLNRQLLQRQPPRDLAPRAETGGSGSFGGFSPLPSPLPPTPTPVTPPAADPTALQDR